MQRQRGPRGSCWNRLLFTACPTFGIDGRATRLTPLAVGIVCPVAMASVAASVMSAAFDNLRLPENPTRRPLGMGRSGISMVACACVDRRAHEAALATRMRKGMFCMIAGIARIFCLLPIASGEADSRLF